MKWETTVNQQTAGFMNLCLLVLRLHELNESILQFVSRIEIIHS